MTAPLGARALVVQRLDRRRRGDAVERHVQNGRDTPGDGRARSRLEPFPLGATGLVYVDVGIDQSRHDHSIAGIVDVNSRSCLFRACDTDDTTFTHMDGRGAKRAIDEHSLAAQHELAHRAMSAPKRLRRFPQTRRR